MISGGSIPIYAASGGDIVDVRGSSTVEPFASLAAEDVEGANVKVESGGSGAGLKAFCESSDLTKAPDIANASRAIKASERALCKKNGVTFIELPLGKDGIAIATSINGVKMPLTLRDIFLAMAARVPNPDGSKTLMDNPYTQWNHIRSSLPKIFIDILGAPDSSGTFDALLSLGMEGGCKTYQWIKDLKKTDKKRYKLICHSVRKDGSYQKQGENDNLIVQKLVKNPHAVGVFGYSYLVNNTSKIQGNSIGGFEPTFDNILSGDYPLARPLFMYIREKSLQDPVLGPQIKAYLLHITDEGSWGTSDEEDGSLVDIGLIPHPLEERKKYRKLIESL